MKTILYLVLQDFKRLLTNAFFWILSVTLILLVLVLNFALPENEAGTDFSFASFNTGNAPSMKNTGSAEELYDLVSSGGYIGLDGSSEGIVIVHPDLNPMTLNAVALGLSGEKPVPVLTELTDSGRKQVPFNKRMLPVFLCFEALVTGCILGGALMIAEREQGVIKAMITSPLTTGSYLLSKVILFSLIGTVYASLLCIFTLGFSISWIPFMLLSFTGTSILTLLGLGYTTLFHDISSWFFSLVLVLSINMLPVLSYYSSSFTPFWMRLIPSYPVLFAYSSILFGGTVNTIQTLISIGSWLAITAVFAFCMCRCLLLKRSK